MDLIPAELQLMLLAQAAQISSQTLVSLASTSRSLYALYSGNISILVKHSPSFPSNIRPDLFLALQLLFNAPKVDTLISLRQAFLEAPLPLASPLESLKDIQRLYTMYRDITTATYVIYKETRAQHRLVPYGQPTNGWLDISHYNCLRRCLIYFPAGPTPTDCAVPLAFNLLILRLTTFAPYTSHPTLSSLPKKSPEYRALLKEEKSARAQLQRDVVVWAADRLRDMLPGRDFYGEQIVIDGWRVDISYFHDVLAYVRDLNGPSKTMMRDLRACSKL